MIVTMPDGTAASNAQPAATGRVGPRAARVLESTRVDRGRTEGGVGTWARERYVARRVGRDEDAWDVLGVGGVIPSIDLML